MEEQIPDNKELESCSEDSDVEISLDKEEKTTYRQQIFKRQNKFNGEKLKLDDKEYVCLFRGIRFSKNMFDNDDRRKAGLHETISGKTDYCSACFINAELGNEKILGKYISGNITEENLERLHNVENFTKNFIDFLYNRTDLRIKKYKNKDESYFYESLLLFLINVNTNTYDNVDDVINKLTSFLTKNREQLEIKEDEIDIIKNAFKDYVQELSFSKRFFISTSVKEETAIKYALPEIDNKNNIQHFNPEYDTDGKPRHRFGGLIEIIFIPKQIYIDECEKIGRMEQEMNGEVLKYIFKKSDSKTAPQFIDLILSNYRGLLHLKARINEQFEVNFLNKIDGQYVVASFPIYFPNFSKEYDEKYHKNTYGISKKQFEEIKELFKTQRNIEAIKIINKILIKHFSQQISKLVSNIMASYKQDTENIEEYEPLKRFFPKIDENLDLNMEEMKPNTKAGTIHERVDDTTQKVESNQTEKTKITFYTSNSNNKFCIARK